ncbi:MAG: RDD family protein [Bacteroidetes bacterium]|nr:RDD family protein [Bacteroidota bacterium]
MLIYLAIVLPLLTFAYGVSYWTAGDIIHGPLDVLLSYVFPAVATILFWVTKQATPGKMVIRAKIVDARTGMVPTTGQYIGRYFAYILSTIPLFLGFIWIAIDGRKQGWHDKLAGTVVVSPMDVERETVNWD